MYEHDTYPWEGDAVHTTFSIEDVAALRQDRSRCTYTVSIGDVDLPAFISNGIVYIQASLPHVFEAFAEDLSAFERDMEVRISGQGGRPLPPDSYGRPFSLSRVAQSRMVRSGGFE